MVVFRGIYLPKNSFILPIQNYFLFIREENSLLFLVSFLAQKKIAYFFLESCTFRRRCAIRRKLQQQNPERKRIFSSFYTINHLSDQFSLIINKKDIIANIINFFYPYPFQRAFVLQDGVEGGHVLNVVLKDDRNNSP